MAHAVSPLAPADQPRLPVIAGVKLATYIDWMKTAYHITVTSHPAISVPAGFTDDDPPLPVGLQIVGPMYAEPAILRASRCVEQACATGARPHLASLSSAKK